MVKKWIPKKTNLIFGFSVLKKLWSIFIKKSKKKIFLISFIKNGKKADTEKN